MNWFIPCLVVFMVHPFCVVSEVRLTQPGESIVKLGQTLSLMCTITLPDSEDFDDYAWSWIRQSPGKGLEWMGFITTNQILQVAGMERSYTPSLKNRLTFSLDSSTKQLSLQLHSVTASDTGTYYCARGYYSYWSFDHWGSGTAVTVSSASPTAPTVFPLPPCCQDFSTASQVTLGCLVTGYFPEPVSVKWKEGANAISTGIRTFPAITHSSGGHYTLSSQLTVPASSWPSKTFQCNVDHPSTSSTISKQIEPCKTVAPKHTPVPVAPVVSLFHSSCTSGSSDAIIELVCHITGFYPSDVVVDWMEGEQTGVLSSYTEPPRKDENENTFSTISTANISQSHWQDGNMVTCQVTHPATGTKERRTAKICEGSSSSSEVRVFILRPDPYDVFVEKRPKLTCVVINLESDIGLAFNWKWDKPGPLGASVISTKDELNGTITASSNLFVSEQDWMSGGTFTCTVQHSALPLPKSASISKKKEKATAPNVYLFRPHHEELISNGEYVSITALVKGFKPNEIALSWLHDNEPLPEANFVNSPVLRDGDNTYVMFSKLKVPKSEWNRGRSFSCMVVHEGLRMKFIQKNIEKPQGKK